MSRANQWPYDWVNTTSATTTYTIGTNDFTFYTPGYRPRDRETEEKKIEEREDLSDIQKFEAKRML